MNFKNFIDENIFEHRVQLRELTKEEIEIIEKFQSLMSYVYNFFVKNKIFNHINYEQFKQNVEPYLKYDFSDKIKQYINNVDQELKNKEFATWEKPKIIKEFADQVIEFEKVFYSLDIEKSHELAKSIKQNINILSNSQNQIKVIINRKKHNVPFYIEPATFFGSDNFIDKFDFNDMRDIFFKNINEFKYTYLNFPFNLLSNYEYLVYFINELKNNKNSLILNKNKFQKFSQFVYQDDNFTQFKNLLDQYLYNNNRKLIPQIMKELENFPDLIQMNNKLKSKIKYVYRGLAFGDEVPSDKEIIDIDKKNRFVATTDVKLVAKRFAERRGHLSSERTSEIGYIIKYDVSDKNAILLNTAILGDIYNESEILIDTKYAKIKKIIDID